MQFPFWRRLAAITIDTIILGIFGLGLGMLFFSRLTEWGSLGRLFGLAVMVAYYGILNSRVGNGQTPGKRICKIQVTDKAGNLLSLPRSFLRALVLMSLFNLSSARYLNSFIDNRDFVITAAGVVFGGLFGLGYFFLFNRATRQSLHDLLAGSYVVLLERKESEPRPMPVIWPAHLAIFAMVVVSILASTTAINKWAAVHPWTELLAAKAELERIPGVESCMIIYGGQRVNLFAPKVEVSAPSWIQVTLHMKKRPHSPEDLRAEVMRLVLANAPGAEKKEQVQVVLHYGFDIGIASYSEWSRATFNMKEWLEGRTTASIPEAAPVN